MNYAENLFRMRAGYCKGDDTETQTQSSADTNQTDQRVGASEHGVAVGAGGMLDQSYHDESQVTLNTADNSNRSTNIQDSRDQSTTFTDNSNRSITDNRTFQSLDGELSKAALQNGADALKNAGDVLLGQLETNTRASDANAKLVSDTTRASLDAQNRAAEIAAEVINKNSSATLGFAGAALEKLLDNSAAQTVAAAKSQTDFVQGFYTDRQSGDVKVVDGLTKSATAIGLILGLVWALKS